MIGSVRCLQLTIVLTTIVTFCGVIFYVNKEWDHLYGKGGPVSTALPNSTTGTGNKTGDDQLMSAGVGLGGSHPGGVIVSNDVEGSSTGSSVTKNQTADSNSVDDQTTSKAITKKLTTIRTSSSTIAMGNSIGDSTTTTTTAAAAAAPSVIPAEIKIHGKTFAGTTPVALNVNPNSTLVVLTNDQGLSVLALSKDRQSIGASGAPFLNMSTIVMDLDFHYRRAELFYTYYFAGNSTYMFLAKVSLRKNSQTRMNGTSVHGGRSQFAVDWVHDRIYWIKGDFGRDETANEIAVSDMDGAWRMIVLRADQAHDPEFMTVDPLSGHIFWVARNKTLWRCQLDGSAVQRLVDVVVPGVGKGDDYEVVAIAANHREELVYVLQQWKRNQTFHDQLMAYHYNGSAKGVLKVFPTGGEVVDASVFEGRLYWYDVHVANDTEIFRVSSCSFSDEVDAKEAAAAAKEATTRLLYSAPLKYLVSNKGITAMTIYDEARQPLPPPSDTDHCRLSGCQYCVGQKPNEKGEYVCRCPEEMVLQDDGRHCAHK